MEKALIRMLQALSRAALGTGFPFLMTTLGAAVVFFFGSTSLLARNTNLSFAVDLVLMAIIATIIYSYLFKKTSHNVLYVLLAGTVLSTFFTCF